MQYKYITFLTNMTALSLGRHVNVVSRKSLEIQV